MVVKVGARPLKKETKTAKDAEQINRKKSEKNRGQTRMALV